MPFIAVDFSFDLSYRPVGPSKQAISDKSDDPRSHKQGAKPCSVTLGRSGLTIGITFRAKTKPKGYYKCCDEIFISFRLSRSKSQSLLCLNKERFANPLRLGIDLD